LQEKKLDDISLLDVVEIAHVPDVLLSFVSFLVGLRTYQHPGTGGWVGPRASLDRCGKSHPPPGSDPWTASPYPVSILTTLPGPLIGNVAYVNPFRKCSVLALSGNVAYFDPFRKCSHILTFF